MQKYDRGTWIDAEELAYDRGQARRGRAIFEDGKLRAFRAGVADTFFSIPAHARIKGRYVPGFLTIDTSTERGFLVFHAMERDEVEKRRNAELFTLKPEGS